jgi:glucose-6-phosphate isomerase
MTITADLQNEGVDSFTADFEKLLDGLAAKREALVSQSVTGVGKRRARLGALAHDVEHTVERAVTDDVARRVWEGDATLWSDEPHHKEIIANRLGWLSVHERMEHQIDALTNFATQVKDEGVRHVVLLGMGGSSLCPEVLRRSIGSAPGYPELLVLDSTDPAQVQSVADAIDPARTIFIVSSKSGGTLEPNEFYARFREEAGGDGSRFVAITDPDTALEALAGRDGFRKVFTNPPDIGGRYSALSYFGLVPAALIGVDLNRFLGPVDDIVSASSKSVPADENPSLWLGCALGAAQKAGRDKVTLVSPPPVDSFGLWVEQLFAESTGKSGIGIVPVAGEPLGPPEVYGNDRVFVAIRIDGDGLDGALDALVEAGHPVIEVYADSAYDLGREFWRFEFATAVAGWALGIDPFDEPNVAEAKAATKEILDSHLPDVPTGTVDELVGQVKAGDYVAILAYTPYSDEGERAVAQLREKIRARTKAATTFGYGPRYLHSTGQLHKGGPNTGVYLIVTTGDGQSHFGQIEWAQALGDYQTLQKHDRRVVRVHVGDLAEVAGLLG